MTCKYRDRRASISFCSVTGNICMERQEEECEKTHPEYFERQGYLLEDEARAKEERLRIVYNDGVLKDGIVYIRPCLTVVRDNYVDMIIENRFYDEEAVELYKKLTGRKREE